MPRVSIIVPIYNVEQYLRECLHSIVNQTLQDIEIICVNDGSTDGSLNIIKEFALRDKRFYVIDKPNSGYGHSMNTGMSQATGDYIGIVESDDFAAPDMFERLYIAAEENSAQVVKSNYFEYRSHSEIKKKFFENLKECPYHKIIFPMDEQNVFFVEPSIWSGIYKRSFLTSNNIRFNETPGASFQDTSFAFKVWASAERVYLINEAFLHYRRDNLDSSVKSASKVFCICDEYDEIEKFLISDPFKEAKLASLVFAMKFRTYQWNYQNLVSAFQYAFLLKMVEELKRAEKQGYINTQYLTPLEVNEINNILSNPDRYFKDTAKDYRDNRLLIDDLTLNMQFYKDGFLDCISKYKNVIIFGAGVIGKNVAQKLVHEENMNSILCFAVSDLKGNPESLLRIPVLCINELIDHINDSIVLVAVKEKDQYEIIKLLKSYKFRNIVSIDSNLLKALSSKI